MFCVKETCKRKSLVNMLQIKEERQCYCYNCIKGRHDCLDDEYCCNRCIESEEDDFEADGKNPICVECGGQALDCIQGYQYVWNLHGGYAFTSSNHSKTTTFPIYVCFWCFGEHQWYDHVSCHLIFFLRDDCSKIVEEYVKPFWKESIEFPTPIYNNEMNNNEIRSLLCESLMNTHTLSLFGGKKFYSNPKRQS